MIPTTWDEYRAELARALESVDAEALDSAEKALRWAQVSDHRVWIVGNGGSAATANHLACDLSKNARPRVMALSLDGLATMTAYANDEGYSRIFAEPLRTHARPDDVLIAISTSGMSPNVAEACKAAQETGITVIALTAFGGGEVWDRASIRLHVDTQIIEAAEDAHSAICHELTRRLKHDI